MSIGTRQVIIIQRCPPCRIPPWLPGSRRAVLVSAARSWRLPQGFRDVAEALVEGAVADRAGAPASRDAGICSQVSALRDG